MSDYIPAAEQIMVDEDNISVDTNYDDVQYAGFQHHNANGFSEFRHGQELIELDEETMSVHEVMQRALGIENNTFIIAKHGPNHFALYKKRRGQTDLIREWQEAPDAGDMYRNATEMARQASADYSLDVARTLSQEAEREAEQEAEETGGVAVPIVYIPAEPLTSGQKRTIIPEQLKVCAKTPTLNLGGKCFNDLIILAFDSEKRLIGVATFDDCVIGASTVHSGDQYVGGNLSHTAKLCVDAAYYVMAVAGWRNRSAFPLRHFAGCATVTVMSPSDEENQHLVHPMTPVLTPDIAADSTSCIIAAVSIKDRELRAFSRFGGGFADNTALIEEMAENMLREYF